MEKPKKLESKVKEKVCDFKIQDHGCSGAIYGLGTVGAAIYFASTSTNFWGLITGFLKALVWPAFVVYGLLRLMGL